MSDPTVHSLLRDYVTHGSESAFRELVRLHTDLVYSVALRRVGGDVHLAADVTQATFTNLARKAASLPANVKLGGWLHQDTCFRAATMLRGEIRRRVREQKAAEMNAIEQPADKNWSQLAPLLDEALCRLGTRDREALILRYFENKSLADTAMTIGVSEDAAQKIVSRAVEKLRVYFGRHGVQVAYSTVATAIATNSVRSAPAGLATKAADVALAAPVALPTLSLYIPATAATVVAAVAVALVVMSNRHTTPSHASVAVQSKVVESRSASMETRAAPSAQLATSQSSAAPDSTPTTAVALPDLTNATGPQVLAAVARQYAGAKSYFDRGLVRQVTIFSDGRRRVRDRPFTTAFVRGDRFRYEYWDEGDRFKRRCVVWSDGNEAKALWPFAKPNLETTPLHRGLAGATGISGSSASTIPNLLLPDQLTAFKLTAIADALRTSDEIIEGAQCIRIEGHFGYLVTPLTVWIEKDTGLVRQLYSAYNVGTYRTETTTSYSPFLNQPIPSELLQFDVPAEK